MHIILQPDGWTKPVGYSNGMVAGGKLVFIGGQVGWNKDSKFETDDLVEQVQQTLKNVVTVLAEAGAGPQHVTSMTWYLRDRGEYLARQREIGEAYRAVMGRHYPPMAALIVNGFIEERAKVEIQAIAVVSA